MWVHRLDGHELLSIFAFVEHMLQTKREILRLFSYNKTNMKLNMQLFTISLLGKMTEIE